MFWKSASREEKAVYERLAEKIREIHHERSRSLYLIGPSARPTIYPSLPPSPPPPPPPPPLPTIIDHHFDQDNFNNSIIIYSTISVFNNFY
ncbi:hypothetical protein RclHR1_02960007 [Rhizophagus clarus]|uniref:Uncharacterized protein n=1 Tax=Rhizophagus clarus TaxID=94130 RepID=A0A2Z6RGY4_9GLOM|nr:hypothetical protein RclHR1_02960007 [Rhizophagus clarus]GES89292.1 hypothetical protein RCL_e13172_RclHR1_02960007 [Rhizophagus clarus]